jgi:tRNA-dihydrouridine synthase B
VERARLPVIANGDITGPETVAATPDTFAPAAGLMLGRIAAVRPWVFAAWRGDRLRIDPAEVWQRFSAYVEEDFSPDQALVRLKIFAKYYGRNFAFGHRFHMAIQNAPSLPLARDRAAQFFDRNPDLLPAPNLLGL